MEASEDEVGTPEARPTGFKVEITPSFGDERLEGDFDDDEFMRTEVDLQTALGAYLRAGARSNNVAEAISNVINDEV